MNYIDSIYTDTLEVKQSKFIAYLTPFFEYEKTLIKLKEEHSKARHFVVAYRYLNQYEQIVEYSSDDGEPNGTSGRPSLFVLQGAGLINTAVIVVRYFGGTKLGPGGLVRAYSDAINLSLQKAKLLEYKKEEELDIRFEYSIIRMVEYECEELGIEIVQKSFDSQTLYKLRASKESMDIFFQKMSRLVKIV